MADTTLEAKSYNGAHQIQQNESLLEERQPKERENFKNIHNVPMRERLKDSSYRSKLLRSWLIAWAFFSLGLTAGLNGASLLDLQIITNTDLEEASIFFTGYTSGSMAGALVSGAIFSMVNTNLLLFMAVAGMGAATVVTPYCSNYPLMIFVRAASGFFSGGLDGVGNAGHMRIWGNEGKVLMQIIHFCFAIGGVLSPLYAEPFLAKRASSMNATEMANFTNGNLSTITFDPQTTDVHYAFIISGIFMIVASIPFLVLCAKDSKKTKYGPQQNLESRIAQRELPLPIRAFILIMICTFFLLYCCIELTFASFLIPFLVNEYDFVTKAQSVYINVIYWVSFAASRFVMIFVSRSLCPVRLLYLCLTLMAIAYVGFIISASFAAITALAVFTAVAGLGMSAVFAAGFSWAESELVKVTARISSSISIGASIGKILNPLFLGFLMEEFSNMWFCYVLVGQTAVLCLLFIFLLLFNRHYINKNYGSLKSLR